MDLIRRNDGQMEPTGSAAGRKVLLPWEIQICEALEIEPEDYFEYFDLLQQAKQERAPEYDNIPNVVNEPASTVAIILTVVGTALSVASALLAPKPRAPEQQKSESLKGDDVRGRTKYSPLRQFDNVQQLATLSDVVPLVYTNKQKDDKLGGVRVESQLLWSQIKNKQTYQIIKVLLLFSGGEVERRPDFKSYAFGSQKIQAYGASRIDMSFAYGDKDQGPLVRNKDTDAKGRPVDYEDAKYQDEESRREYFAINNLVEEKDRPKSPLLDFCGVQTPSTSAQFGQYSPISNGTGWRFPFEFPGRGDGQDQDTRFKISAIRRKHAATFFRLKTYIEWQSSKKFELTIGDSGRTVGYIADEDQDPEIRQVTMYANSRGTSTQPIVYYQKIADENSDEAEAASGYGAAANAADENREFADSTIAVGDTFLLGDMIITCTQSSSPEPWETLNRYTKHYKFELDETYTKYSVLTDSQREDRVHTDYKINGQRPIYRTDYTFPLQKVSIGAVSTSRAVDAVEIGIKSIVWRRINGYPNVNQHPNTGAMDDFAKDGTTFQLGTIDRYTSRISFFRVEYREEGNEEAEWVDICPGHPFAVKGNNPQGQYNSLKIYHNKRGQFEYRFIPISGNCFSKRAYAEPERIEVNLFNGSSQYEEAVDAAEGLHVFFRGVKETLEKEMTNTTDWIIKTWNRSGQQNSGNDDVYDYQYDRHQNPNDVICDYFTFDAEESSHRNEPEHEIVFCNEIKKNSDEWYTDIKNQYSGLSYAGMTIAASRNFSNLSDVSAYFTKGVMVERLTEMRGGDFDTEALPIRPDRNNATNLFPEIAYDLLTNKARGAGELVGRGEVHEGRMRAAARFCEANEFFWDGVISDAVNIRDFIYEQAVFCLCDFTIIGGMFALVPTVPYFTRETTSDLTKLHQIDHDASISNGRLNVKALFTDGNMRNYKVTFLASAERENFVAEVKYREEKLNGFPEMKSFRIRLKKLENDDRNEFTANDTVEVFDMTQFCTNQEHAINFAKFALQVREKVDHAIVFETTPDCVTQLAPGDYIRVVSTITHNSVSSRINVGCVTTSGVVHSAQTMTGTHKVYYWKPGNPEVRQGQFTVGNDGKVTDAAFNGTLFSVITSSPDDPKIYKVESISLTEDGMVEVAGSYQPLTEDGKLQVLDWDDSNFVLSE